MYEQCFMRTNMFFQGKTNLRRFPYVIFVQIWAIFLVSTNGLPVSSATNESESNLCLSAYCLETANEFLESIDETVDPCEDFYKFTCGNWMQNLTFTYRYTQIPEVKGVLNNMHMKLQEDIIDLLLTPPPDGTVELKAITNARHLFKSCSSLYRYETGDVFDVLNLIDKEFGGWPGWKNSAWGKKKFDLAELLLKFNQYNFQPIFDIETGIMNNYLDIKNYDQRNNGTQSTSDSQQFTSDDKYIIFQLSSDIRSLNRVLSFSNSDLDKFKNKIYEQLKEETAITRTQTTIKNISQTIGTNFDFGDYIRRVYLLANITLRDDDIIIVRNIETVKKMSSIIAQESIGTLQEYLIEKYFEELGLSVSSIKEIELINIFCAKWTTANMGYAVSKLYLDKYFDDETFVEAKKMVKNMQETFIEMINQSTWMDESSRKIAIEKTQAMVNHVGYPEQIFNDDAAELEDMYSEYEFGSIYVKNVVTLLKLKAKEYFEQLRNPLGSNEWSGVYPTSFNAFYVKSYNKILVPAAFLQTSLFHKDAPKYLNYGGTGCFAGHEFGHAFDDKSRHLDKDQNKYLSWSSEVNEKFVEQTKCLIEHYNGYEVPQTFGEIDAYKTLDEDTADNHGLKIAFKAYKKWINDENIIEQSLPGLEKYTPEQLFFINYGYHRCSRMNGYAIRQHLTTDTHSLPQFRINGPTSNFDEFDRVFQCKPGQGNSRVNKCGVW